VLPLPAYRRVLDVPCGGGRHVRALQAMGYDVVGVDNDPAVSPEIVADLRDLGSLPTDFDAVINMWASFGYFDAATNERVLAAFAARLRPGGRLVLDLFNRQFFERRPEVERELRPGIVERSRLIGARRRVELDYGDDVDVFEWQLYTPGELLAIGGAHGLVPVLTTASLETPSMHVVLERDAASSPRLTDETGRSAAGRASNR
jgi:SAM-dependent methyltransferase